MTDSGAVTPIVLLDNMGYGTYRSASGRPFFPADHYDVRLVTDLSLLHDAHGPEVESVLGVMTGDEDLLHDAAAFLCGTGDARAAAVVAISESLLLPAARIRAKLGYPGLSVAETTRFRDKVAMKATVGERGIRVPEFHPFSRRAAEGLVHDGEKAVVKPRLGTGSIGVTVLHDRSDVDEFLAANEPWLDELEVEEFIDGPQYHIDSVVDHGRVVAATAGYGIDATTSFAALRPYRDIGLGPGPLQDELLEFNDRVVSCFPEFSGVTHHEVFRHGDELVFCEIAARAGGGGVVAGFESRTGANLLEIAIHAQANGRVPHTLPVASHLTGYVLIYAGPGLLREPIEPVSAPWVVHSQVKATPGTRLRRPQHWADAVALVVVRGDTEQEVAVRIDAVVNGTRPSVATHPGRP